MLIKVMKRIGAVLFYIGGIVWVVFTVAKYLLDCDVTASQFLPYHLCAIIPGMLLKYGLMFYERTASIDITSYRLKRVMPQPEISSTQQRN